MSATILIVDDEESILKTLGGILEDEGYRVLTAGDGEEALAVAQQESPELVMLDIWMPRMEGLEALQKLKELNPELTVVMMSGHGTIETAVKSTKMGAYDFIEKPLSLEKVIVTVNNALGMTRLRQENATLRGLVLHDAEIIGSSPAMLRLQEQIRLVASTEAPVLMVGENGTGKDQAARTIHLCGTRRDRPFVELNCSAIPEELLESELFGHEKGAFAGATAQKKGRLDAADGGTLYLEEIGDMPLKAQARLLRFLEEKKFERVGGNRSVEVNVRLVASASRGLEEEVRKGRFREDLLYRLNVISFLLPPLRERKSDIPELVEHFLGMFCRREGRNVRIISPEAVAFMQSYDWPGNVRELRNIVERLVIMTHDVTITERHLPEYISRLEEKDAGRSGIRDLNSLREARDEFEKEFIIQKLGENGWNVSATADMIDLERSILQRKIKSYGINLRR
jgi:two-component system, NtrC family, nitrogen regulation response regulator NtrX